MHSSLIGQDNISMVAGGSCSRAYYFHFLFASIARVHPHQTLKASSFNFDQLFCYILWSQLTFKVKVVSSKDVAWQFFVSSWSLSYTFLNLDSVGPFHCLFPCFNSISFASIFRILLKVCSLQWKDWSVGSDSWNCKKKKPNTKQITTTSSVAKVDYGTNITNCNLCLT